MYKEDGRKKRGSHGAWLWAPHGGRFWNAAFKYIWYDSSSLGHDKSFQGTYDRVFFAILTPQFQTFTTWRCHEARPNLMAKS